MKKSEKTPNSANFAEQTKNKEQYSAVLEEAFDFLQLIQASAKVLENPVEIKTQILASNFIRKNVQEVKGILSKANEKLCGDEEIISFENQTFALQKEIPEKNSIGIFSKKDSVTIKLRLVLQSYGFFVRIFKTQEEAISAAKQNLIQMLIVSAENENFECFTLCKNIRNFVSDQDFSILLIADKFRSYLTEKLLECKINDYIIQPFDISELLFRIQQLEKYRNLNKEKQAILKSEKEKNTFLYFVTHNVNTPLTLLLNEIQNLQTLEKNLPASVENEKQLEFEKSVQNLQKNARAINIIIQNVLNSYKISDRRYIINPKILNLKDVLKHETEFLIEKAKNKSQNFSFSCAAESPRVFCDEYSLKGIYINLVDNAIKYTKPNGNITVSIEENTEFIILNVIDDGPGIPKEKQGVLFDRFAKIGSIPTGTEKSFGLGLYVVNEICKLNDLFLEYSDNKNAKSGSVFSIKFKKIG